MQNPTVPICYTKTVVLTDALDKLLAHDKKTKSYTGTWTLTASIRELMLMPFKTYQFTDLSATTGHSTCRVYENTIHLMSPRFGVSEAKAQYGRRLIISGLIALGYLSNDYIKPLEEPHRV